MSLTEFSSLRASAGSQAGCIYLRRCSWRVQLQRRLPRGSSPAPPVVEGGSRRSLGSTGQHTCPPLQAAETPELVCSRRSSEAPPRSGRRGKSSHLPRNAPTPPTSISFLLVVGRGWGALLTHWRPACCLCRPGGKRSQHTCAWEEATEWSCFLAHRAC